MTLDRFRLDGQAALVTGGDKGLGQGMAVALARAGADVAVVARSGRAEETLAAVAAAGRRGAVLRADLEDAASAARLVDEAAAALGRDGLDVLVNNAGTIRRADALETDLDDWRAVLEVNLTATWVLSRAAARGMAERGRGKIVNVASLLAFQGGIRVPAYAASKHAVAGLTKALANELAPRGVNVNAIAPGYMATANTEALRADPERASGILGRIPAARWGTPEDLAGAVVFLASGASDYVHGHVLVVDGGWLAR